MPDPTPGAAPATPPAGNVAAGNTAIGMGALGSPPPAPWHQGIEPEVLGLWQNRGIDLSDPKIPAVEMTKAYKEFQKLQGVPRERLLRLPENADDVAGWSSVWERLGAPKESKDYTFNDVKFTDGSDFDPAVVETMRATFAEAHIPKDAAAKIMKGIVKSLEDRDAQTATLTDAKLANEQAAIQRSWGANANRNMADANEGAKQLGWSREVVEAISKLEGVDGTALVEGLRRYGRGFREAEWVDGERGGTPPTQAAAAAQRDQFIAERRNKPVSDWTPTEKAQLRALQQQIAGVNEADELARLGR